MGFLSLPHLVDNYAKFVDGLGRNLMCHRTLLSRLVKKIISIFENEEHKFWEIKISKWELKLNLIFNTVGKSLENLVSIGFSQKELWHISFCYCSPLNKLPENWHQRVFFVSPISTLLSLSWRKLLIFFFTKKDCGRNFSIF